jgi:hypothetical protein
MEEEKYKNMNLRKFSGLFVKFYFISKNKLKKFILLKKILKQQKKTIRLAKI